VVFMARTGMALSRIGLWSFDLIQTKQLQDALAMHARRNKLTALQFSMQSGADLLKCVFFLPFLSIDISCFLPPHFFLSPHFLPSEFLAMPMLMLMLVHLEQIRPNDDPLAPSRLPLGRSRLVHERLLGRDGVLGLPEEGARAYFASADGVDSEDAIDYRL
jgi:hypothetical protein